MGGSDYSITDSRIGNSSSPIGWQATCDNDVTGWLLADDFVFAFFIQSTSHTPDTENFKVQWSNNGTDWSDLAATGEMAYGTSDELNDTDPVGSSAGCRSTEDSEELEGDGTTKNFSLSQNAYGEIQVAIDPASASKGTKYYFRLWSNTANAALSTADADLTTEAAPAAEIEVKGFISGYSRGGRLRRKTRFGIF